LNFQQPSKSKLSSLPCSDGKAQQTVPYPSGIYTPSIFTATSDEFNGTALGKQWQWNHQPDNTKWSLAERPGYMTLHTATVNSIVVSRS
jgi:beta-xylosidase